MKRIIIFVLLLVSIQSFAQPTTITKHTYINNRYIWEGGVFRGIHVPSGTTPALTTNQWVGSGALYYDSTGTDTGLYVFHNPYWVRVGSSPTGAGKGVTLNGTNVDLGSPTALNTYTPIVIGSIPLTINHNGINNANQSDSNGVRYSNNTLATSITDSLVTPGPIFKGNSWRTTGSSNRPFSYQLDGLGLGGSSTNGTSHFRLRVNMNTNGWGTMFAIQPFAFTSTTYPGYKYSGSIVSPLSINSIPIGSDANGGSIWFGAASAIVNGTATTVSENAIFGVGAFATPASLSTRNVAIGNLAMGAATNTNFSTGVGYQALSRNDSDFNSALGYNSMQANTTGVYNTAVGANSLYANTTGAQNAAFGYNALLNNTTGQKNTAIGPGAMENSTTGSFNTFVGHDAGLQNTTGDYNASIGWLSWAQNVTGHENIGLGVSAGRNVVNGYHNVALGNEAMYLDLFGVNQQEDTVRNSIAIGAHSFTTASNQMRLGNDSLNATYIYGIALGTATSVLKIDSTTKKVYYTDRYVRTLESNTTQVGNVGGGEDNLMTYAIPGNLMSTNGDRITFTCLVTVAGNGTLKGYYGGTQLFSYSALSTEAVYRLTGEVVRTGATTQIASFVLSNTLSVPISGYQLPTETLSGNVTFKLTYTGTNNDDGVQRTNIIDFYPKN